MGGKVHDFVSAEIAPAETREFHGYTVHKLVGPKGNEVIVDDVSGGTVGATFDDVEIDIIEADREFLNLQLEEQRLVGEKAPAGTPEDFWRALERK